ncbi:MAG: acyltransferase [Bdellovibrionales bacterium]|nr:acyltransferase [Bdellovibrionales bacterium]
MWSLSFEEQFYVVLGLCLVFLRKRINMSLKVIVLLTIAARFLTIFWDKGINFYRLQAETHMRLDAILLGCLAYLYYQPLSNIIIKSKYISYSIIGLALITFYLGGLKASNLFTGLVFTLTAVSFSLLILVLMNSPEKYTFLKNKYLCYVGRISYEIYLIHQIINAVLIKVGITKYPYIYCILLISISFLVSTIYFQFINKPIQEAFRKKFISTSN